ncbi:MAG TPA: cupin domain-containing protein [Pyrinomonadaceae bacterium]|nr:cupin domain-containing protein [Pyrinomonadaceae bacterium]
MTNKTGMKMPTRRFQLLFVVFVISIITMFSGGATSQRQSRVPPKAQPKLPDKEFTHPPEKSHDPTDFFFNFDQLEYYYRLPGEFTHRLTGDQYGFESLSFIITETHPGGGPGLHVHDTEEAHVLLEGTAQYRIGDKTFTVQAPYVARVPAGVPHTFINSGSKQFNLIAVFASKHPNTRRIGPNPLIPSGKKREEPPTGPIP